VDNYPAIDPAHLENQGSREVFFWHTSCNQPLVARKFQARESFPVAAKIAALNLRMATIQLDGMRDVPRVRKISAVRRRLPVTVVPGFHQEVIIRHIGQNLDNPSGNIQPGQSPRL